VLDPDGVRVLAAVLSVGALPIVTCRGLLVLLGVVTDVSVGILDALGMPDDLPAGLAGETNPVGVLGLDPPVPFCVLRNDDPAEGTRLEVGVLRGILEGVPSSVLSRERLEPCLDGGLLPGLLPVLDAGLELDLDPPGVSVDLYDDGFRGVRKVALSLSDSESGVPADNEDLVVRGRLPIGTDRAERSRTLVIGP
jgi:hypothetical protein